MQIITKYKAYNGNEFTTEEACLAYEKRCKAADAIIARLPERPDSCDFSNGDGYIQHCPETFRSVRRDLLTLANEECPHQWFTQSLEDENVDPSWAGRMISECCTRQLDRAWGRISCTDGQFREWGQPYFRSHPEEAKTQKAVNL